MQSINAILKSEFTRIARREMTALFKPLKKEVALLKKAVLKSAAAQRGKRRLPDTSEPSKPQVTSAEIKRIRKRLGLTQKAFAAELGVSVGAVTGWEAGRFKARPAMVSKIISCKQGGKTRLIAARKGPAGPGSTSSRLTPLRIKKIRKRLGLTQKNFAKKLNVSPSAVIGWEGGKFKPRRKMTDKIFSL